MPLHPHHPGSGPHRHLRVRPQLRAEIGPDPVPRFRIPESEMPASTAAQIIRDELLLDGAARLNLATFVTTWMEPEAAELMADCAAKNMIDKDEYPQTAELEHRCVSILADLWHAEAAGDGATGCSTTGSSEACMLGGLALERRWRAGRPAGRRDGRPNLVMGANVQVCWEKFCRYFDVEPRLVPVGPDSTCLTAERARDACDESTIGVVAVLGSTYDGAYEPVAEIAGALDELAGSGGPDVPIHVDGASGGFVAPFLDPELVWDFRLPRVRSINASGHKYGLVYPGVGWIVWRDAASLPAELVFDVDYLGGSMPTFALNFSRPGAQVVGQYYELLRLGREGYRRVQQGARDTAQALAGGVADLGPFRLVSDGSGIPAFAFAVAEPRRWTVYDCSDALRARGWQVPAYRLPPDRQEESVLRVVVRNGFGPDLAEMFLEDLRRVVDRLDHGAGGPDGAQPAFHH